MEKIKIIRIIARVNIGGPAIQSAILTDALNNSEFETVLLTGPVEGREKQMDVMLAEYNVRPVSIPELGRQISPIKDIIALYKIFRFIRKYKPHIVHTHTSKAGFLGRFAAFIAGVPVRVHTFHGHTFYGYFGYLKSKIFLLIERMLSMLTDTIITISPLQFRDIVNKYKVADKKRCVIIPLGFDLSRFLEITPEPSGKGNIGFAEGSVVIGTTGRITDIKNHKFFLSVAKSVCDTCKDKDVRFAIVGDGELKEEILKYRDELGLADKVKVFGWQSDMAKFYSGFDIFTLTSKNEGTPVSAIEAMASARPVVSTGVGGVPDIIKEGETGYLVSGFNKREFVDKLTSLIHDPKSRLSLGINARNSVRDAFDKKRLIEDVKILYKKLLKGKGVL